MRLRSFSLTEVLITFLVLSILITSAYLLFYNLSHLAGKADFNRQCISIANEYIYMYHNDPNITSPGFIFTGKFKQLLGNIRVAVRQSEEKIILYLYRPSGRKNYTKEFVIRKKAQEDEKEQK
ncbi:hypothetical protein ACFL6D_02895 [Spirochaetota bacterium]